MKKIVILLMLVLIGFYAGARTEHKIVGNKIVAVEVKADTSAKAATATKTQYTYVDKDGKTYPVYRGAKGGLYILRVSKKTGKEYKYYLPKSVASQLK